MEVHESISEHESSGQQEVTALALGPSDFVLLVLAVIVLVWVLPCWIRRRLARRSGGAASTAARLPQEDKSE